MSDGEGRWRMSSSSDPAALAAVDGTGCSVMIWRGDSWTGRDIPCGKRVKGSLADGRPGCGLHISAEVRRLTKQDAETADKERRDRIGRALSIKVGAWGVDKRFAVVLLDDLESLAKRMPS